MAEDKVPFPNLAGEDAVPEPAGRISTEPEMARNAPI